MTVCGDTTTHDIPDASERPSRSSSTTLYPRTSASTSATFGNPYYGQKDLLSKVNIPTQTEGSPTSTLPLCLLTDSVQLNVAHTPLPFSKDRSFLPARNNALIPQHPTLVQILQQSTCAAAGILLKMIIAY